MTQAELLKEEYNQEDKNDVLYSNFKSENDVWYRSEVEEGLKELDEGKFVTHEEAKRILLELDNFK